MLREADHGRNTCTPEVGTTSGRSEGAARSDGILHAWCLARSATRSDLSHIRLSVGLPGYVRSRGPLSQEFGSADRADRGCPSKMDEMVVNNVAFRRARRRTAERLADRGEALVKRRVAYAWLLFAAILTGLSLNVSPSQALEIAPKIEQCLQGTSQLSVVMLVDESKSLQNTDPMNDRVTGLKSVLAALNQAVEDNTSNRNLDVEVLFAGFYGDTHPKPEDTDEGSGWLPLNGGTISDMLERADRYATANTGPQTDYVSALLNARDLLTQRAAERTDEGGSAPCNLIVFFTDGGYYIGERGEGKSSLPLTVPYAESLDLSNPDNPAKVMEQGKGYLCAARNGLITQMGREGTVLLTVALARDGEFDGESKRFLRSLSTGDDGCGNVPGGIGDYVETGDSTQLFFKFNDSLSGKNSTLTPLNPCSGMGCLAGGNPFNAIEGEKSFELLADIGTGGTGIRFITPNGSKVNIPSGDGDEIDDSGVSFTPLWISNEVVQINGVFDTATTDWVGNWNVALTGRSDGAIHSLTFAADLTPVLESPAVLTRGEKTRVRFRLDDAEGGDLEPNPVTQMLDSKAQLGSPTSGDYEGLDVRGPDENLELSTNVDMPVDNSSGIADIGLTINFDAPDGHFIEPIYQPFSFEVKLPDSLGYPSLSPAELNLASITGDGESSGEVTLTGTSGNGCVWLNEVEVAAPADAGEVDVRTEPDAQAESSCIPLAKGESKTVTVVVAPANQADGTVEVELDFGLASSIKPGENQISSVHTTVPIAKSADVPARLAILIGLIILGAALPVLLLHLMNRSSAEFSAPQSVLHLRRKVQLDQGSGLLIDAETSAEVDPNYSNFTPVKSSGREAGVRGFELGSLVFRSVASISRTPRILSLFHGPVGVVRTSDPMKVLAGGQVTLRSWSDHRWQEVPLGLPGTWIFEPVLARTTKTFVSTDSEPAREDSAGIDPWAGGGGATSIEASGPIGSASSKREATPPSVSGTLTLLIHYGGSTDQGRKLLEKAQQRLKEIDWSEYEVEDDREASGDATGPGRSGGIDDAGDESRTSTIDRVKSTFRKKRERPEPENPKAPETRPWTSDGGSGRARSDRPPGGTDGDDRSDSGTGSPYGW